MNNAALIAKLEQAQEGSRALSDEVLKVVYGEINLDMALVPLRPDPTCNLQEALHLMPEEHADG